MYERAKVAAKKSKAKEFKTIQTQKNRFNNHSSPFDQILFLQRTIGNQAVENLFKSGIIQAKLKIGKSNDIYEQEADRVAEQIVSSSWSIVNNQVEEGEIQRQTEEEERKKEEEEEETLQLKKMQGNISEVTPDIESRIRTLRGSGQPLPKSIRAFFEPRFGYDFSYVRIHTDPEAAKLARALNAEAFTYGRDIYFGEGRYNPNTLTGKRLLAHELAHVVQQTLCNSRIELQRNEDITQMCITEDWARHLGDYELEQQIQIVRNQLMTCSYSSPECEAARTNLKILEQEIKRRERTVPGRISSRRRTRVFVSEVEEIANFVYEKIGGFWGGMASGVIKLVLEPAAWVRDIFRLGFHSVTDPSEFNLTAYQPSSAMVRSWLKREQAGEELSSGALIKEQLSSVVLAPVLIPVKFVKAVIEGDRRQIGEATVEVMVLAATLRSGYYSRYYPFARRPTAAELMRIREGQAIHFTTSTAIKSIDIGNGKVAILPMRGTIRNILIGRAPGESAYFFLNEPSWIARVVNIGFRDARTMPRVIVRGTDLPSNLYYRPIDGVIIIPRGYTGPGQVISP